MPVRVQEWFFLSAFTRTESDQFFMQHHPKVGAQIESAVQAAAEEAVAACRVQLSADEAIRTEKEQLLDLLFELTAGNPWECLKLAELIEKAAADLPAAAEAAASSSSSVAAPVKLKLAAVLSKYEIQRSGDFRTMFLEWRKGQPKDDPLLFRAAAWLETGAVSSDSGEPELGLPYDRRLMYIDEKGALRAITPAARRVILDCVAPYGSRHAEGAQ